MYIPCSSRHYDVIITSPAAERQGYYDLAQQVLLCGTLYMYSLHVCIHVSIIHSLALNVHDYMYTIMLFLSVCLW